MFLEAVLKVLAPCLSPSWAVCGVTKLANGTNHWPRLAPCIPSQDGAITSRNDFEGSLLEDSLLPMQHGGTDAQGLPAHDFSTNANACGPCPDVLAALQTVDAGPYPDPAYTALCQALAAFHGVEAARICLGASGSELIQRLAVAARLQWCGAVARPAPAFWQPAAAYGDYARASRACGFAAAPSPEAADLLWLCEPSSPHGQALTDWPALAQSLQAHQTLVLDRAYAPLCLQALPAPPLADAAWQIFTPNKALGLTGIRAAYAIAPVPPHARLHARLRALEPSWSVGAHGVALLQQWVSPPVQQWLHASRQQLARWKAQQTQMLQARGWQVAPSLTNFLVARPPVAPAHWGAWLAQLRAQGVKLRDCAGFGLPGQVRLAVGTPAAQDQLARALSAVAPRF